MRSVHAQKSIHDGCLQGGRAPEKLNSGQRLPLLGRGARRALLLVLVLSGSCARVADEEQWIVNFGKVPVPASDRVVCFAVQHGDEGPVCAILWLADRRAGAVATDLRGRLNQINGRPVVAPMDKQAIYLLHPDYSLEELFLKPAEVRRLFRLLDRELPNAKGLLFKEELWQAKVMPLLKFVPMPVPGADGQSGKEH